MIFRRYALSGPLLQPLADRKTRTSRAVPPWNSSLTKCLVSGSRLAEASSGESARRLTRLDRTGEIISFLLLDIPPNGVYKRNVDLVAMLRVSRRLHEVTLSTLYRNITIPHSRIFQKFLSFVETRPMLGRIVRRLDFSHFNPAQLFATAAERLQARNLTPQTLLRCLELTPRLQEFLAQEYLDEELDDAVLQRLFLDLPCMAALDFCGCSSTTFVNGLLSVGAADQTAECSVQRLSLHKCLTLPSSAFELLLPQLGRLTHLDVAGTRMTDAALMSIPNTARITHLNLAKCTRLTARGVINFLAGHPSASHGLVFLSLASDARSHQLLDAEDVSRLLPLLPGTLKSLSLKGARMNASHMEQLRPLTQHLEELACGRCLASKDINRLFGPRHDECRDQTGTRSTLKYMDLSDMWAGELDLPYLFSTSSAMLQSFSEPLEVVEFAADDVFKRLSKSPAAVKRAGWRISVLGSRAWLVRGPAAAEKRGGRSDGRRAWKMGAEAWGMRKIPVAVADVGGMYGSFMFARKL